MQSKQEQEDYTKVFDTTQLSTAASTVLISLAVTVPP